ncbi:MAG: hypothetical protein H5T84_05185, partial [Thermoleophilia bacterium]|nr:hypothetical protein [Thermoleophilia bacterium]
MNAFEKSYPFLSPELVELASLYNVHVFYRDTKGHHRYASPAALVRVLQALGVELAGRDPEAAAADAGLLRRAVEWRRAELWSRMLEPVLVAWEGRLGEVVLRVTEEALSDTERLRMRLVCEQGEDRQWETRWDELVSGERAVVRGVR